MPTVVRISVEQAITVITDDDVVRFVVAGLLLPEKGVRRGTFGSRMLDT
jgi:hypothetical protein